MKIVKKNNLLKVLSLNSVSVAVSFVLGIVSTKFISFFLGASGMALMGSFRNFSTMLKSVATVGISNSVVKLYVENKKDDNELSVIYSTFFWIFLFISLLLGCVVFLFAKTISVFLFFSDVYFIPIQFFGMLLPLMVINTFWLAIYNGLEKFKRIIVIQIISNIFVFAVTVLLIWKQKITGGLFSVAIGELLMVLVTFLYVRRDRSFFQFDLQKAISKKYIDVIKKFSAMTLLSAIIAPLTLIFIRNIIVGNYSLKEAGIWDAINRLSGFYMLFFTSGLSMYYMPKLAALQTDAEFKSELKIYFKTLIPLFFLMLLVIFMGKGLILKLAFTSEFDGIKEILIWQLSGDFFKVMTLAFGYQIVVKTMMKRYFIGELIFNVTYFLLAFYLMKYESVTGVVKAYFYTNVLYFFLIFGMFRKLFYKQKKL